MHDLSALESNESDEVMEWEDESDEAEFEEPELEDHEHDEAEELESAAELLAVGNEAELDQFIGGLIRKAAKSLGRVVKAKTGNSLGGLLKGFARQALPMVATAIGGPVGGLAAKGGLDVAMKAFGLELEGLSEEDQELEIARRYVRVANAASRRVLRQRPVRDHRAQARSALRWALRRHAPNLLRRHSWRRRHPYAGYPRAYAPGSFNAPMPAYGANYGADYGNLAPAQPPPAQCPACAPCPACPECGAPTPNPPNTADTQQTPLPPAEEFEFGYEDEEEEAEALERAPLRAEAGAGGRWVRRGNRIILYGA